MSERGSFFKLELSARAYTVARPEERSLADNVGLLTNALRSGTSLMVLEMELSSDWTLVRVCGDFERAAENTALEYLLAMVEAARRPRPTEAVAEGSDDNNMVRASVVILSATADVD